MLTKNDLAIILAGVKEHPNPKYYIQQFSLDSGMVAEILFLAEQDIMNKVVFVPACGTGRFAIGAALLGAKEVHGIDVDKDALEIASKNAEDIQERTGVPLSRICKWVWSDIKRLKGRCDTVIQFPPVNKDEEFLKKGLEIGKVVYSIHPFSKKKERVLRNLCKDFETQIMTFDIPTSRSSPDFFLVIARKPIQ